jgi:hypothetical protein
MWKNACDQTGVSKRTSTSKTGCPNATAHSIVQPDCASGGRRRNHRTSLSDISHQGSHNYDSVQPGSYSPQRKPSIAFSAALLKSKFVHASLHGLRRDLFRKRYRRRCFWRCPRVSLSRVHQINPQMIAGPYGKVSSHIDRLTVLGPFGVKSVTVVLVFSEGRRFELTNRASLVGFLIVEPNL